MNVVFPILMFTSTKLFSKNVYENFSSWQLIVPGRTNWLGNETISLPFKLFSISLIIKVKWVISNFLLCCPLCVKNCSIKLYKLSLKPVTNFASSSVILLMLKFLLGPNALVKIVFTAESEQRM